MKAVGNGRYRRISVVPEASLDRETGDNVGEVACQNLSTQIHGTTTALFQASDGAMDPGSAIIGIMSFNLPQNFKGFKPAGIELDIRPRAEGLSTGHDVIVSFRPYRPHCTDPFDFLPGDSKSYEEETAPAGVEALPGVADSYQHDIFRITAQDLGDIWRPGDTVRIFIQCTTNGSSLTSIQFNVGVLKVNYKT